MKWFPKADSGWAIPEESSEAFQVESKTDPGWAIRGMEESRRATARAGTLSFEEGSKFGKETALPLPIEVAKAWFARATARKSWAFDWAAMTRQSTLDGQGAEGRSHADAEGRAHDEGTSVDSAGARGRFAQDSGRSSPPDSAGASTPQVEGRST